MKVIVVGAVAAGMSTAAKLKRNLKDDVEVVVYEKGSDVSYGACGLPFFISDIIKDENELYAKPVADFIESGIDLRIQHEVLKIDQKKKQVEVKDMNTNLVFTDTYDYLVMATGARGRRFDVAGEDANNVLSVHSIYESVAIKDYLKRDDVKDVIVIGAGFIGMEMLEACKLYGKNITLLQHSNEIFSAMDEEFREKMEEIIEEQGVRIIKNANVKNLDVTNNEVTSLTYDMEGKLYALPTQLVIKTIGIIPSTDILEDVKKSDNGAIEVDELMRSSDPNIFAGGDCSVMKSSISNKYIYAPLGTNANKQGRVIADVLSNIKPKPFKLLHSMCLRLFDYDIARIGISVDEGLEAKMNVASHTVTANSFASYYRKEKITIKVVYEKETRKILGVQCIGQGSVIERANYYAVAIYSGLTVDEMGMMDLAYSPPFNGVWDAALIASNTIKK